MKIRYLTLIATVLTAALLSPAPTAIAITPIVIDGNADAAYGPALSTQNTNTQFGNNTNSDPIINSGGSEIDQIFATVVGDRLYMTIAGNLEANFNKLEVYIDSKSGGFNTLGAGLPTAVDGYCCNFNGGSPPNLPDPTSGALQRQAGLTFDAGFDADYYLTFNRGTEQTGASSGYADGTSFYALSAHYADLQGGTSQSLGIQLGPNGLPNVLRDPANPGLGDHAFSPFDGGPGTPALLGPALPGLAQGDLVDQSYATTAGTDVNTGNLLARELAFVLPVNPADPDNDLNRRDMKNTVDLQLAYDDSNVGGVNGDSPYTTSTGGDPQNVMTGLEFSIPLSSIGSPAPGDMIQLVTFVNNSGHDYASNQFGGDGVLDGNLGGNGFGGFTGDLSGVNLDLRLGEQFVTVTVPAVPEPTTLLLIGIAMTGLAVAHHFPNCPIRDCIRLRASTRQP